MVERIPQLKDPLPVPDSITLDPGRIFNLKIIVDISEW